MAAYELFLDELAEFKDTYSANLSERIKTIKINYLNAMHVLGMGSTAEGGFIEIADTLKKVENLADLGTKIKTIQTLGSRVQRNMLQSKMLQIGGAKRLTDDEYDEYKVITEFQNDFNDFAYSFLKDTQNRIIYEAKRRLSNMSDCPYGQAENRTKNALDFEQNVIKFFAWIFLDEIRLLKRAEIREEQLKRDGIFRVLESFDFQNRRIIDKIQFGHILVECKNYKKPSYNDLMQVHAYTLLNKIFPTVNQPLCLVISRENPSQDSITYKMRDKLFEKKGDEFLLVLFLACDDLQKMYDQKHNGGDPFEVLTAQIKKMDNDNITRES